MSMDWSGSHVGKIPSVDLLKAAMQAAGGRGEFRIEEVRTITGGIERRYMGSFNSNDALREYYDRATEWCLIEMRLMPISEYGTFSWTVEFDGATSHLRLTTTQDPGDFTVDRFFTAVISGYKAKDRPRS